MGICGHSVRPLSTLCKSLLAPTAQQLLQATSSLHVNWIVNQDGDVKVSNRI